MPSHAASIDGPAAGYRESSNSFRTRARSAALGNGPPLVASWAEPVICTARTTQTRVVHSGRRVYPRRLAVPFRIPLGRTDREDGSNGGDRSRSDHKGVSG